MKRIIFILGGARSGKSSYALRLAAQIKGRVVFIATCSNPDKEMQERIRRHKLARPRNWRLVEEGSDIASILTGLGNNCKAVLIDCLGLWVSNLLANGLKDGGIKKKFINFMKAVSKVKGCIILVSNDVGGGIVPDNLLARRFRDLLGFLNQMVAENANQVIFMQCGIPMEIKEAECKD